MALPAPHCFTVEEYRHMAPTGVLPPKAEIRRATAADIVAPAARPDLVLEVGSLVAAR